MILPKRTVSCIPAICPVAIAKMCCFAYCPEHLCEVCGKVSCQSRIWRDGLAELHGTIKAHNTGSAGARCKFGCGQAGKPVAFFVSKNGSSDGIDAWVASVLNAGFGTGGDAAQIEVLTRIAQVPLSNDSVKITQNLLMPVTAHGVACQTNAPLQGLLCQLLHGMPCHQSQYLPVPPASRHIVPGMPSLRPLF